MPGYRAARNVAIEHEHQTSVSDAAWVADLGAHGLVHGSFLPPEPIRQLRDLTHRTRTTITRGRAREIQRLEKLLEDAGIKLSSVASDISGVSGRLMLDALIAGQRDPRWPSWRNGGCGPRSRNSPKHSPAASATITPSWPAFT